MHISHPLASQTTNFCRPSLCTRVFLTFQAKDRLQGSNQRDFHPASTPCTPKSPTSPPVHRATDRPVRPRQAERHPGQGQHRHSAPRQAGGHTTRRCRASAPGNAYAARLLLLLPLPSLYSPRDKKASPSPSSPPHSHLHLTRGQASRAGRRSYLPLLLLLPEQRLLAAVPPRDSSFSLC